MILPGKRVEMPRMIRPLKPERRSDPTKRRNTFDSNRYAKPMTVAFLELLAATVEKSTGSEISIPVWLLFDETAVGFQKVVCY